MNKLRSLNRTLYISLLISLGMILCRVVYTGQLYGSFLVWNLFLAWLPFVFSQQLSVQNRKPRIQYAFVAAWLLFFPNAPYIITDFFHLKHRPPVPYWYDLLILFWASWNGLLLGIISLMNVERFLSSRLKPRYVNMVINLCLVLCAFGVYAGRYLRWNSWDVIFDPKSIIKDITYIAFNPVDNLRTWGVTFFFSLLMIMIYKTLKGLREYSTHTRH
ncbi:MAG: DUF1361 domain-containing protein [Chitinophagaceae bacterium]|nr:DUF1361 domain-containing protein [Chitinophagaceae bacterium]MCW5928788.1 DUF1361 domain-containing protein [Chitinophagaceae bacterium]